MTARESALKILYAVDVDGAYCDRELKKVLGSAGLSATDNGFATELVYGVVKNRTRLDHIIRKYSSCRLKKISPMILNILRMGVYQIIFLDKIPPSAAVNESVKLAKRYGHSASAGFTNGVLRSVVREGDVEYPSGTEYYEVFYSHPKWLVDMLIDQYGELTAKKMIKADNMQAETTIRANTLKTDAKSLVSSLNEKGITAEITDKGMIKISGYGNMAKVEEFINGHFTVQDTSAMLAGLAVEPKSGETVMDVCAAPGGKTTHLAEMMGNKGKIIAFDIHPHRVDLIKANAKRLGIDIIDAMENDATKVKEEYIGKADRVIADVPCSGLGIIRKKPDIKWIRTPEELDGIIEIQKQILSASAQYVKSGGTLVYSTCTVNKNENRGVVDELLLTGEFEIEKEQSYLQGIDKGDGFYICTLRRK